MAKQSSTKTLTQLKAENAELKAENARLAKKASAQSSSSKKFTWNFFRHLAIGVLVFFAVVLLTVGNIAFWTGNTLVKQDRFVAATAPIIKDPEVQSALALYTTNQLFKQVDVEQITQDALPPKAQFLAPQLAEQIKSQTNTLLNKVLDNPKFQDKWNATSAGWHDKIITFATNYKGDGHISVNDVYSKLSAELKDTKLSFLAGKQLPAKVGSVTVVNATWLPTVHKVVTKIDTWRILSVLLLVLALVGAVMLSRSRRRTIYLFSFSAALAMLLTMIALGVARESVVAQADPQYAAGVRSAVQILTHSFAVQTITIMLAALLVGFVAWISGQSKTARAVKNQGVYVLSGKIHESLLGSSTNSFVRWVQVYKRQLQWATVGILAGIMLLVHLTLKALFGYAALMLVLVLLIEVIGSATTTTKKSKKL